jgi:hypothetical protein
MTTQENNKLIAEFMGSKTIRINVPFEYELGEELPTSTNICNSIVDAMEEVQTEVDEGIISGCDLCMEAVEYHTSWDWLMPVVEKIKNVGFAPDKMYNDKSIDYILTNNFSKTNLYHAVVEFIKSHNHIIELRS